MTTSVQSGRLLAESLSEALNCAAYVLQHPTPSPEILDAFFDATDQLLRVHASAQRLQGPPNIDLHALFEIVRQLRAALPDRDLGRVPSLCTALFQALGLPPPTTAA